MQSSDEHDFLVEYLRWPPPLELIWVGLPALFITGLVSLMPIDPYDYWWVLALGRMTVETGEVASKNFFLYTLPADREFLNLSWLSQVVFYSGWEWFGHSGWKTVTNATAFTGWLAVTIWASRRSCQVRISSIWGVVLGVSASWAIEPRARLLVLIPFLGLLWLVTRILDGELAVKYIWLLFPLSVFWVNIHGSFLIIPGILGLAGGATFMGRVVAQGKCDLRFWRHWFGLTAATFLAPIFHPFGIFEVYTDYFSEILLASHSSTPSEWQSFFSTEPGILMFWIPLSVVCLVCLKTWRSMKWFELALITGLSILTIYSRRMVFWWASIVGVFVPRYLAMAVPALSSDKPNAEAETTRLQGIIHLCILGGLLSGLVSLQPVLPKGPNRISAMSEEFKDQGPGKGVFNRDHPFSLVERLKKEGAVRVFHHQAVSGLLEFEIGAADPESPEQVVFVDQRYSLVPGHLWNEYGAISAGTTKVGEALRDREINALLVKTTQRGILSFARKAEAWRLAGDEENYRLFLRQ